VIDKLLKYSLSLRGVNIGLDELQMTIMSLNDTGAVAIGAAD